MINGGSELTKSILLAYFLGENCQFFIAESLKTGVENDVLKYVLYRYFSVIDIHSRLRVRGVGGGVPRSSR